MTARSTGARATSRMSASKVVVDFRNATGAGGRAGDKVWKL
ncbi:MAG TPA: hypothetical protein VF872_09520 [Gaiellaceae bacterium]